ncbi:hypothetical protein, conserved [Plasmodium gonderi]|uniref:RNA-binding S4 domain-containing protein n=1 Tax=Plasmodium gonderi TaxID=77519 RepID=A0A1Y1JMG9_PLAGO|nr:hypothetical protein, conserved [Plasmodium gonderi]GAW83661.1 hypothetical protein, conserved [Plasmodium gonderi]
MFPSVQLKKSIFLRLSKILSLSSVTSRSKAQELIKSGKVKVNNQAVNQNVSIDINSTIEIDGKRIHVDITTKLWGIYKPRHVFCSSDWNYQYEEEKENSQNNKHELRLEKRMFQMEKYNNEVTFRHSDKNIFFLGERKEINIESDLKKQYFKKKKKKEHYEIKKSDQSNEVVSVLRPEVTKEIIHSKLNMNIFDFIQKKNKAYETKNKVSNELPKHLIVVNSLSTSNEGLVLLTNDGDFAKSLKDVNNNILTTYIIKVQEELTEEKIKLIKKGCFIENFHIEPLSVHVIKQSSLLPKWLKFTYVEKSHTHLDILFSKYNLTIRKCKRFSFGPYRSSDLSEHFLTPLKIHSTLSPLIPKYTPQLVLSNPSGNIQTDVDKKFVYVKDYLKNSIIQRGP